MPLNSTEQRIRKDNVSDPPGKQLHSASNEDIPSYINGLCLRESEAAEGLIQHKQLFNSPNRRIFRSAEALSAALDLVLEYAVEWTVAIASCIDVREIPKQHHGCDAKREDERECIDLLF